METTSKTTNIADVVSVLRDMLTSGQSDEMLALVEKLLRQMLAHNARLELRLAALLRDKFGRRTEKLDAAQLSLVADLHEPRTSAEVRSS